MADQHWTSSLRAVELKGIARRNGIRGYGSMRRDELEEEIRNGEMTDPGLRDPAVATGQDWKPKLLCALRDAIVIGSVIVYAYYVVMTVWEYVLLDPKSYVDVARFNMWRLVLWGVTWWFLSIALMLIIFWVFAGAKND